MNLSDIKSLRLGPFDVRVEFVEGEEADYMDECGSFCRQRLLIRISERLCWQNQLETLLHEIMHGVIYAAGIRMEEDKEEDLVARTTPFLLQFLRDNPHFMDAIDYYSGEQNDGQSVGDW